MPVIENTGAMRLAVGQAVDGAAEGRRQEGERHPDPGEGQQPGVVEEDAGRMVGVMIGNAGDARGCDLRQRGRTGCRRRIMLLDACAVEHGENSPTGNTSPMLSPIRKHGAGGRFDRD